MPFDLNESVYKSKTSFATLTDSGPQPFPHIPYDSGFKRALDITLVILFSGIIIPLVALMAFFVSLDGHLPFYTQQRVGRNGKVFRILKMRSMVHDADALLAECLARDPVLKAEWETTQKLKDDIRITRIGRLLRKTSMDELPQMLNVLTGSMSLVGPRPMMPCQQELYPGKSYYRMRPGVTGFWQIADRNNGSFSGRATFDEQYEQSMSLVTDVKVMAQTVVVVLRGTGF